MVVTIHQPSYLPWPPFLEKALRSDAFVFLDDVQFEKGSEQNRNRIKAHTGALWLTVPVSRGLDTRIPDVRIPPEQDGWRAKHRRAIEMNYDKAPYFSELSSPLFEILDRSWTSLLELNLAIDALLLRLAGFGGATYRSSELEAQGSGSERILSLCRRLGATTYLSGPAGLNYLVLSEFEASGVEVLFQDYDHRPYPQQGSEASFVPRLSAIDMMMNVGIGQTVAGAMCERGRWRRSEEMGDWLARHAKAAPGLQGVGDSEESQ